MNRLNCVCAEILGNYSIDLLRQSAVLKTITELQQIPLTMQYGFGTGDNTLQTFVGIHNIRYSSHETVPPAINRVCPTMFLPQP